MHSDPHYYSAFRFCTLIGTYRSSVVLFDRRNPSFENFDSPIPTDVVGMKSYMDSLFDPTWSSLTLRVYEWGSRSTNLTLLQMGICPVLLALVLHRERAHLKVLGWSLA